MLQKPSDREKITERKDKRKTVKTSDSEKLQEVTVGGEVKPPALQA